MSLRITGGRLRGRALKQKVQVGVRPTSARVREALFSMLGQDLSGLSVLDGFGGSGLLALEAASRGAGPVVVVELRRRTARAIGVEADRLGVALDIRVGDLRTQLHGGPFDVVLLDPPYAQDPGPWLALLAPLVRQTLIMEHDASATLPDRVGGLRLVRARTYGDTGLTVYEPAGLPSSEE